MNRADVIIGRREGLDRAWREQYGSLPIDPGAQPMTGTLKQKLQDWYRDNEQWTQYQAERKECAISSHREAMYLAALLQCGPPPTRPIDRVDAGLSTAAINARNRRSFHAANASWRVALIGFHKEWSGRHPDSSVRKSEIFIERYKAWWSLRVRLETLA